MTIDIFSEEITLIPFDEANSLQIRALVSDMVAFTKQLVVDSDGAYRKLTALYNQARTWKKAIEQARKDLVEPFRRKVAAINDRAKDVTDPLDSVIAMANSKVQGYQRLLEEQKKVADAQLLQAAALFDAADDMYIAPMEKSLRGDGATATTRLEKRFNVVDKAKVPLKYLVVDEAAIKRDLKLGVLDIPGIEVYEEKVTQLRVR